MAYFIGLVENAGQFEDEKTGVVRDYHNFLLSYADEVRNEDRGRNEIATSKYRAQEFKIKGDDVSRFFGIDVVAPEQFDNCYGAELELKFGRNGLSSVRFIDPAVVKEITEFKATAGAISETATKTDKKKA